MDVKLHSGVLEHRRKEGSMKEYIRKNYKVILLIFVLVPILIYVVSVLPIIPSGGNNDWAGFWGGYIGAIIGGVITWKSVEKTIEYETKMKNSEYIKSIRPILSSKFKMLTYDDIVNLQEGRGAVLEISAERAGSGDPLDKAVLEKYLNGEKEEIEKKCKFVQYRLVNLSNGSANKVSLKLNQTKPFSQFSILPNDEVDILFIIHLVGTEKNKFVKLELEFEFEDELGKKRYRQCDEMDFFKDDKGKIHNSSKIMAMTCPEEII